MGSGKTTLGEALGRIAGDVSSFLPAGCRYADLDRHIEEREGMSVREIFRMRGEEAFRRLEAEALRELGSGDDIMEWMNTRGLTVLLEASHATLLRRLLEAQEQRPLLAGLSPEELADFISAKLDERAPWYGMARIRFGSDRLESAAEIVDTVKAFGRMLEQAGHL